MSPDATPLPVYDLPLEVKHLVARYGDREILSGVNLAVKAGEIRVILGGSGGGKTTLLKHLIGLMMPAEGAVNLLGVDLKAADEPLREAVLGKVGMLFQSGALLNSLTVLENVALPLRERTTLPSAVIEDIAWMKLSLVGLEQAGLRTPPELSGGMKKRAALARAMVLDPDILFCDEPSAGLDPVMAADLDELILSLRDQFGMAVVVVTHELASIHAIADRVLMLARGKVIADGPLEEVQSMRNETVRTFFDRVAQARGGEQPSVLEALRPGGSR
ncbi:MAG TPA: ATP-binding cassette domain-containing protein [Myxococcota bacterium]|nr:ATP-binding cassette domain-containing protein [Myxococcota bacterium]